MKIHIGVDSQARLVQCGTVTAANVHNKHLPTDLLHGEERPLSH